MRRGLKGAALAAFVLVASPVSAQDVNCDAWAASDAAWPEVETILRNNYAYLSRVDDVDALMAQAETQAADVETVGALGTIVETLGYAFRDGHFHVSTVAENPRAWIPSSSDFWVVRDGDRFIVADLRRGGAAYDKGLRPGWELTEMDGEPIEAAARAALAPVVPEPTPEQVEYAVNVVLTGRLGEARSFTFRNGSAVVAMDLPPAQESMGDRPDELLSTFRHEGPDGEDLARIRVNNALGKNETIAAFDAAMARIDALAPDGLILDLRDTPGGGNTTVARAILGHFMREPAVYQIHRNHYEQAVFGVPRQYAEYVFVRGDGQESEHYRPVVVLAGYWTGSVGEALAMAFDRTGNYPTIGTGLGDLLGTLESNPTSNRCLTLSFAWDSLYARDGTPREDWEPGLLLPSADTAPDGSDPALAAALEMLSAEVAGE